MKKIIQAIIAFSFITNAFSQSFTPPAYADIDNNYRNYVNQVFGALEPNRVNTGLLLDYGFDFTDPKFYNGSILVDSTLIEQGIYSELYKTLYTGRFNTNTGSMRHPSIHDSLCYIARQKETITLSGLLFNYNAIDPNAQAYGKMQTVNGQLTDVYINGNWQNPYQEFTTVAISPSITSYKRTYCSVKMPANLFLSNMANQVSSIQFDADDGQGYRSLQYDVPLSLNYADTGWKHWTFRITLTNSQQLYSHSKVHFNNTSNIGNALARGVVDLEQTIISTESFDGLGSYAKIKVSYRSANDPIIRKPLIIAEGFDAGHIINPEEDEGTNGFEDFINSIRNSNSLGLQTLISGDPFIAGSPSEYDLIYVNWGNGTDWLQRNALVLEQVIRWVNANKQPLGGVMQPNVVLGSSMGGVIARMALGRMDRGEGPFNTGGGFNAHQTRLYVSVDAPHQGANVPLGYQAAARHAARIYIGTGPLIVGIVELVQLISNGPSPLQATFLADQPAARQLLSNRIDFFFNTVNATHNNFMTDLRTNWAYPANIRNIAISNGSECAIDQEFAAGSSLLYHFRSTKNRFIGDLIFMLAGAGLQALNFSPILTIPLIIPGSNKFELMLDIKALANNGGNQVYYGNIKLTKKVLWLVPVSINVANKTYNASSGLLPFDSYPGGFYTVSLGNQPSSVSQDWFFSYNNSFFIQRRFSFIPTTSALDIGLGNTPLVNIDYTRSYIGQNPPAPPLNTPFQNFTTAYNANPITITGNNNGFQFTSNGDEPHEGFFIRNSNWLAEELNGNINVRTDCSGFCSNGTIAGAEAFCTTETYTAPFGIGATYNWTVSPAGLANINIIGNTIQITRNGNASGILTISVAISGACGSANLTRTVSIGTPITANIIGLNPPTAVSPGELLELSVSESSLNYYWSVQGGTILGNSNSQNITVQVDQCPPNIYNGYLNVSVMLENNCGIGDTYGENTTVDCSTGGGMFRVSPNPAETDIMIEGKIKNIIIKEIRITDKLGNIKKNIQFSGNDKKVYINISNLPSDIYFIQIFDGKVWESKQLSIKH